MQEQNIIDKVELKDKIKSLQSMSMKLSLDYADNLINKVADKDELKQLNEFKKHLKFAEKLYIELFGKDEKEKAKPVSVDVVAEIKKINSSLGEIVRAIPT